MFFQSEVWYSVLKGMKLDNVLKSYIIDIIEDDQDDLDLTMRVSDTCSDTCCEAFSLKVRPSLGTDTGM